MWISTKKLIMKQKRNSEGISKDKLQEMKMYLNSERNKQPGAGDYCPELVNSLNYKIYKEAKNSEKKPGFNNGQKRFFERNCVHRAYYSAGISKAGEMLSPVRSLFAADPDRKEKTGSCGGFTFYQICCRICP